MWTVLFALVACDAGFGARPCSADAVADVLVMGDSIFAFHAGDCASVADVVGDTLDVPVKNASESGAMVSPAEGYRWGDIRAQYSQGDWSWLVLEGGINDLTNDCDCGDCDEILDSLSSQDGTQGDMPELVDQAIADGLQVALVGYYEIEDGASRSVDACNGWLDLLQERYTGLADQREGVVFVDPGQVVTPSDTPDAYDRDGIHPSQAGAALLGGLIADEIGAVW